MTATAQQSGDDDVVGDLSDDLELDDDSDADDDDFDPDDPDPCSCYAASECPQWLFRKLTVAVREGAAKWPSALPNFSSGAVRYENIHGMCYGPGDKKSWVSKEAPAAESDCTGHLT